MNRVKQNILKQGFGKIINHRAENLEKLYLI